MRPIIRFSYLGNRDYLDMTSVLDSFWTYFGFEFRQVVKEMEFKILSPIEEDCYLLYGPEGEVTSQASEKSAVACFSWKIDGKGFCGYLIPNGNKIVSRVDEPKWNFEEFCEFKNNKVTLKKNFKNDVCFNLTKMGKYLISKFQDPNVRIVKFYFRELIPQEDMLGSQLYMVDLKKKGFVKIVCENKGQELGYILVKANAQLKRGHL